MGPVPFEFQIFAKPAGAVCNLDCRYCYYLDKRDLYREPGPLRMSESLLESYIVQHIQASPGQVTTFSWHGGEPTILGLEYFRKIVELQRKHRPAGRRIANGIQTNGWLLDQEWCRFLASEEFSIGLSLDGPAGLHDAYRLTRGGEPTHSRTLRAFDLLRKHGVPTDIVCVVNNLNVRQPLTVYRFFRDIGCRSLGFLPAVGEKSPYSPSAEEYGIFLSRIFDEWIGRDTARIGVQIFEESSRPGRSLEHSLCTFRETCGQIPVLEHNGDFFSCDYYVDLASRLGNILETPLAVLLQDPALRAFGDAKRDSLPDYCRNCEVLDMCNGGCPKHRIIRTPDGQPGLNYLCAGLKRFFLHAREPLARLESRQQPRAPAAQPPAGRNDPCPCGSGRKYKKCCGLRMG